MRELSDLEVRNSCEKKVSQIFSERADKRTKCNEVEDSPWQRHRAFPAELSSHPKGKLEPFGFEFAAEKLLEKPASEAVQVENGLVGVGEAKHDDRGDRVEALVVVPVFFDREKQFQNNFESIFVHSSGGLDVEDSSEGPRNVFSNDREVRRRDARSWRRFENVRD